MLPPVNGVDRDDPAVVSKAHNVVNIHNTRLLMGLNSKYASDALEGSHLLFCAFSSWAI